MHLIDGLLLLLALIKKSLYEVIGSSNCPKSVQEFLNQCFQNDIPVIRIDIESRSNLVDWLQRTLHPEYKLKIPLGYIRKRQSDDDPAYGHLVVLCAGKGKTNKVSYKTVDAQRLPNDPKRVTFNSLPHDLAIPFVVFDTEIRTERGLKHKNCPMELDFSD